MACLWAREQVCEDDMRSAQELYANLAISNNSELYFKTFDLGLNPNKFINKKIVVCQSIIGVIWTWA